MAPNVEELLQERNVIDASAQKTESELVIAIDSDQRRIVRQMVAELRSAWDRIETTSKAYYAKLTTLEAKKVENEWQAEFLKRKIRLQVFIEDYTTPVEEAHGRNRSRSRDPESGRGRTTLPPLDLKKFDGSSTKDWTPWWEHFEATVDKSTQLKEVEKFSYLMRSLSGLAYDAIKG